jgi:hypothetical protein
LDPLALFIVPLFNFIHLYSATFRHNDAKIYILLSGGGTIGHTAPARNILGGLFVPASILRQILQLEFSWKPYCVKYVGLADRLPPNPWVLDMTTTPRQIFFDEVIRYCLT